MPLARGLGYNVVTNPAKLGSAAGDLTEVPHAEVLGEIKTKPSKAALWDDPELKAQISIEEGPAPWEIHGEADPTDARTFIDCPEDWVLYWINAKALDRYGWRGWQNVRAKDPRVKVLVPAMVTPDGMIRRGGQDGDILSYMPKHWYVKKWELRDARVNANTQSSVNRMESLKEQFARGAFPNVTLESAKHPTHTIADIDRNAP